jgi:DNA polymerase III epsilon subunit family exonuclease
MHPKYVVIDLETTGLKKYDRIVEVGVVKLDPSGNIIENYSTLIRPTIPMDATSIHGITEDMVRHAPTMETFYPQLLRILDGCVLVAHNAKFEVNSLNRELKESGINFRLNNFIDTLEVAKSLPLENNRLSNLADYYGIPYLNPHEAFGDAVVTAQILSAVLKDSNVPVSLLEAVPLFAYPYNEISWNGNIFLPRTSGFIQKEAQQGNLLEVVF